MASYTIFYPSYNIEYLAATFIPVFLAIDSINNNIIIQLFWWSQVASYVCMDVLLQGLILNEKSRKLIATEIAVTWIFNIKTHFLYSVEHHYDNTVETGC